MEILVVVDKVPTFQISVKKSTTIGSIKSTLEKYNSSQRDENVRSFGMNYNVSMFLNNKTKLDVFDTDKYDDMTLKSAWKKMEKPSIVLKSPVQEPEIIEETKPEIIEETKPESPLTRVAFQKMSLEEFAKNHFKANSSREIWGVLMFYMKNYQDDCFPQTKLTIPIVSGKKDYSALKLIWKGTIRSQKSELKSYFKLTYPDDLFVEAKKCMNDKTKRFVLFYLALQIFDPTVEKVLNEIDTKTMQFYYNRKMKSGESLRDARRMSFILQLWTKKGSRIQEIYKLLRGGNLKMPLIKIRIPDKGGMERFKHKETKEPLKPGDIIFDNFSSASNATFSLNRYPLKLNHDDKNFLNKEEIVKWYEDLVEPLVFKGHANLLLLDNRTGELERFEPHGMKSLKFYKENELDKSIEKVFKEKLGITKYYKPEHICPDVGPQKRQEQERREELKDLKDIIDLESGTCVAWTMFYGDLRLRNPDIPRDQVIKMGLELVHDQPQALTRYIVNFMHFLKDAWKELDNPQWVQEMLEKFQ